MTYIRFKMHKKGIPNQDGGTRTCMHCGKKATMSAVKKTKRLSTPSPRSLPAPAPPPLLMDVWFCAEHGKYAKSLR